MFSYGYGGDAEVTRGVLFVEIRINDVSFQFFNCHTQCNDFYNTPDLTETIHMVRENSINEICEFIQQKQNKASLPDSIILCGDFNI